MNRIDRDFDIKWHKAINQFNFPSAGKNYQPFMYDAKKMADEIARMIMIHGMERRGELPVIHKQCSHSDAEPIKDNHLTCCLGVACKACPFLQALERKEMTPEQIDEAKAWTCAAHILSEKAAHPNSFDDSEGWIQHEGDKMFWRNLYSSLSGEG